MYKTHLYPVAFIGMRNFCHCIWVFIFYFISIVYYVISQLSACTSDTCILKDQSINQVSEWQCSSAAVSLSCSGSAKCLSITSRDNHWHYFPYTLGDW